MKYLIICTLVIAGALLAAGCTSTTAPVPTPAMTAAPETTTVLPTTSPPSFTLGDHYLQKSYSGLNGESDVRYEEFRVDNPSWAIGFDVLPLSDDMQSCWFELTVTNMDTMRNETFGYGRDKSFELHQQYPMYTTGPYRIAIKGQRVKVDVTAAKRNP